MSVVLYGNLLVLFNYLCYKLACSKNVEFKMIKRKKELEVIKKKRIYLSIFFIDLEGRVSFAYVPVRDQNLVVRGRN